MSSPIIARIAVEPISKWISRRNLASPHRATEKQGGLGIESHRFAAEAEPTARIRTFGFEEMLRDGDQNIRPRAREAGHQHIERHRSSRETPRTRLDQHRNDALRVPPHRFGRLGIDFG